MLSGASISRRREGRSGEEGSYNIFDGRRRVREIGLTSVHIGFSSSPPVTLFLPVDPP